MYPVLLFWNIAGTEEKSGVQVDLLINRNDNIVNLCEMKFYSGPYSIDNDEELKLLHRVETLKDTHHPSNKYILHSLRPLDLYKASIVAKSRK